MGAGAPVSRRRLLGALGAVALAAPRSGTARDYTSAAEVLDEIDRLAAEVEARLAAMVAVVPASGALADSVGRACTRHRADRAALRERLGVGPPRAPVVPEVDADLGTLRAVLQDLVHAHAEGLPAFGDARAVNLLARHMVLGAQHLTVVDLWLEAEAGRG